MTRERDKKPPFEPGCVPAPGGLLDWRDSQHYDHWQMRPLRAVRAAHTAALPLQRARSQGVR
ncbi:hypothetical protein ACFC96_41225 [Streptomyces sp. NPDC055955]|uniref:hypothetical protein n=1 Tax=Streptomyces sp. NPDC055955 TaxID=3345665 RepID=UPI0035D6377E